MIPIEQILELIGKVPSRAGEWGFYPIKDGLMRTVAVPMPEVDGPVSMLILEFNVEEPIIIDPDTKLEVLLDDERCNGVCWIHTAILLAATSDELNYGIEHAVLGLISARHVEVTITHRSIGDISQDELAKMLGSSSLPDDIREAILQYKNRGSRRRKTDD